MCVYICTHLDLIKARRPAEYVLTKQAGKLISESEIAIKFVAKAAW